MLSLDRLRSGDLHVVVSVSGGKDSAATALHLRELGIPFTCVMADTGWEADQTYRYVDDVLQAAIGPITVVRAVIALQPDRVHLAEQVEANLGRESPMVRECIRKAMIPSRKIRWCTSNLKLAPLREHHQRLMADGRIVVSVVGVRAQESEARAAMPEWEIGASLDAIVWRPILTWTLEDVIAIHARHGLPLNSLYGQGLTRVGCYPCIQACKAEYAHVARDDRRVAALRELERVVGDLAEQEQRVGEGRRRPTWHWGDGRPGARLPLMPPIDVVLGWATGEAVPERLPMSGNPAEPEELEDEPDEGCMRWGVCEPPQSKQMTIWTRTPP